MISSTWHSLYDENDVMICCNRIESNGIFHIENKPVPSDWFANQPYKEDEVGVWRIKHLNMSKLLRLYRMKVKWQYSNDMPSEGIWETISVHDLDKKNPYYKMRCVYPMHPNREHLQILKVWKQLINELMVEVEITNKL